jgi:hypothetical protein
MVEKTLNEKRYDVNRLFFHNAVHDYKLYYEYLVIAFYNGIKNVDEEYNHLKNSNIPPNLMEDVERNLKYYDEPKTT